MERYGGYTTGKGKTNFNKLQSILKFTSYQSINSGIAQLNLLHEERETWTRGNLTYVFTDQSKKEDLILLMKGWKKLDYDRKYAHDNNLNYAQMIARLQNAAKTMEDKVVLHKQNFTYQRQLQTNMAGTESDMHSKAEQETWRMNPEEMYKQGFQEAVRQQGATCGNTDGMGGSYGENGYTEAAVAGPHVLCWNCQKNYYVRDCPEPYCLGCDTNWCDTSVASGYHHVTSCPLKPLRLRREIGRGRGPAEATRGARLPRPSTISVGRTRRRI